MANDKQAKVDALKNLLRGSMDPISAIKSVNAADNYVSNRKPDFYLDQKLPDGSSIKSKFEQMPLTSDATYIQDTLKNTFDLSKSGIKADEATQEFKDKLIGLNRLLQQDKNVSPIAVVGMLTKAHNKCLNTIKKQQEHEKAELAKLFAKDPATQVYVNLDKLQNVFNINAPEKIENLHQQLLKTLTTQHENETKEFNTIVQKEITDLHNSNTQHYKRIHPLHSNLNYSSDATSMKEELTKAMKKNKEPQSECGSIEVSPDKGDTSLRNISLKDLNIIQTFTGRRLKKLADGGYSMKIPRVRNLDILNDYTIHPWIHTKKDIEQDIISLVNAIRASGSKGIVFKISHDEPEMAREYAAMAYAAALKYGFDPKDITISYTDENRNMKTSKGEQLDSLLNNYELQEAKQAGSDTQERMKNYLTASSKEVLELEERVKKQQSAP